MKLTIANPLSFAAATAALLFAASLQAQDPTTTHPGAAEARQMVPARVALVQTIDAGKIQPGAQIRTTLSDKVALKNGTELPAGTEILGMVTTDDMQLNGTSKLAMNFTQAKLKDGKVVPIKATIVSVYGPESQDVSGTPVKPGEQMADDFTQKSIRYDQIGALPGVDLHSSISSNNSGVLLSTSKHDFKLKWGSEFALAVAPVS